MPSRVKAHPFLTLMAVVSAILILVGRVNKDLWWGDWVFVAGDRGARGRRRPLPSPGEEVIEPTSFRRRRAVDLLARRAVEWLDALAETSRRPIFTGRWPAELAGTVAMAGAEAIARGLNRPPARARHVRSQAANPVS